MGQQKTVLQAKGLYTNVNALESIPEGGLLRADNIMIHKPGLISPARGQERLNELGALSPFVRVFQYRNGFVGVSSSPAKLYYSNDFASWTEILPTLGTVLDLSPVSGTRHYYGFEFLGSFYLNTASGQITVDDPSTGYRLAGVPNALNTNPTIVAQGTGSAIPTQCQVGYRTIFGYRNASGVVSLGAPSQRGIVISAGATVLRRTTNTNGARVYNTGSPAANWVFIDTEKTASGFDIGTLIVTPTLSITEWYVQSCAPNASGGMRIVASQNTPPPQTPPPADPGNGTFTSSNATDIIIYAKGYSNVKVNFAIPPGIKPGHHFYQINRTPASPSSDVDPGDDMGLVHEGAIPLDVVTTRAQRVGSSVSFSVGAGHGFVADEVVKVIGNIGTPVAADRILLYQGNAGVDGDVDNWYSTDGGSTISTGTPSTSATGKVQAFFSKKYGFNVVVQNDMVTVGDVNYLNTTNYSLGYKVGPAALSPDGRYLHIIAASSLSQNLVTNPGVYIVFDLLNRIFTTYQMPALPGNSGYLTDVPSLSYFLNYAIHGITQSGSLLKFHLVYVTKNVSGITSQHYVSTSDFGSTWITENTDFNITQYQIGLFGESNYDNCHTFLQTTGTDSGNYVLTAVSNSLYRYSIGLQTFHRSLVAVFHYSPAINRWTFDKGYLLNTLAVGGILTAQRYEATSIYAASDGVICIGMRHRYPNDVAVNDFKCIRTTTPYDLSTFTDFSAGTNILLGDNVDAYYAIVTCYPNSRSQAGTLDWTAIISSSVANARVIRFTPDSPGSYPWAAATALTCDAGSLPIIGRLNAWDGVLLEEGQYTISAVGTTTPYANFITITSPGTAFADRAAVVTLRLLSIVYTDNVPDGALGPLLYTSPSRQGIEQANYTPPLARDCALFRTYGFYADITQQATMEISLLGVGYTDGLQVGDFIRLGENWLEAYTSDDYINLRFKVFSNEGSAFANISRTVRSLIACLNYNYDKLKVTASPIIDSFTPGRFFVQSLNYTNNVSFEVRRTTKTGTITMNAWSPHIPTTVTPKESANLLYYSKESQPGAVPLLNAIKVGSDSKRIIRIEKTREILFIFKEDGIFSLRGYAPPWQVDNFDPTVKVAFPDTVVSMDNNIFVVSNHGLMRVTDSGANLISLPIQNLIEEHLSSDRTTLNIPQKEHSSLYSFSVADPSDHKYFLWLPEPGTPNEYVSYALVYDTYTDAWTRRVIDDAYNPPNHIVLNTYFNRQFFATLEGFYRERRSYTRSDHIGHFLNDSTLYSVSYISADGYTVRLTGNPITNLTDPRALYLPSEEHSDSDIFCVISVDGSFNLTLDRPFTLPLGTELLVALPLTIGVTFAPIAEAPSSINHYREINILFREAYFFNNLRITTLKTTDPGVPSGEDSDYVDVLGTNEFATGGVTSKHHQTRTLIPRNQQRTDILQILLDHKTAMGAFDIEGLTVLWNKGPDRSRRR